MIRILEQFNELNNNTMATGLYKNSEGKLLICKTPYSNGKWSFPTVITNPSKTLVKFLEDVFLIEFGIDLNILDYYETTRTFFKVNGNYSMFNFLAYDFNLVEPYKGQPSLTPNPTGEYTNLQYKTANEIESMFNNGQFQDSSFYYLLRYKNRHGA